MFARSAADSQTRSCAEQEWLTAVAKITALEEGTTIVDSALLTRGKPNRFQIVHVQDEVSQTLGDLATEIALFEAACRVEAFCRF
jgi:hypothetical protein